MATIPDASDDQAFATAVIRRTFLRAASSGFLADLRTDLRRVGVTAAVRRRDTKALFGWLMTMLSYQGISDRVVELRISVVQSVVRSKQRPAKSQKSS
jgi:hypothetical protein